MSFLQIVALTHLDCPLFLTHTFTGPVALVLHPFRVWQKYKSVAVCTQLHVSVTCKQQALLRSWDYCLLHANYIPNILRLYQFHTLVRKKHQNPWYITASHRIFTLRGSNWIHWEWRSGNHSAVHNNGSLWVALNECHLSYLWRNEFRYCAVIDLYKKIKATKMSRSSFRHGFAGVLFIIHYFSCIINIYIWTLTPVHGIYRLQEHAIQAFNM